MEHLENENNNIHYSFVMEKMS